MPWLKSPGKDLESKSLKRVRQLADITKTLTELLVARSPCKLNASGYLEKSNTLTRKYAQAACARIRGTGSWHKEVEALKQACFQGYPESARYVQMFIFRSNFGSSHFGSRAKPSIF